MRPGAACVALVIALCPACAPPASGGEPPAATLTATPSSAEIGQPIELLITASSRRATDFDFGALPIDLERRGAAEDVSSGRLARRRLMVTSFTPGPVVIPPIPVRVREEGDLAPVLVRTGPVVIQFTAPAVTADDDLRPMSGRLREAPMNLWPLLVVIPVVVSLAGIGSRRAVSACSTWRRQRRQWNALMARFRTYDVEIRDASPAIGRFTCHAAAIDLRRALGDRVDARIPFRTAAEVGRLVRDRTGNDHQSAAILAALAALDGERFADDFDAKTAARAVAMAAAVLRELRPGLLARSFVPIPNQP